MDPKQSFDSNTFAQEESIDIKKYLFLVMQKWYWFALTLLVSLSIAYLVNRYSEATYSISSTLILGDQQSDVASVEALVEELGMMRRRRRADVANEVTILKSYSMARRAIEELDFDVSYVSIGRREIAESKLYATQPFVAEFDTSHAQRGGYRIYVTLLDDQKYRLEINDTYGIEQELKYGQWFENNDWRFRILKNGEHFQVREDNSNKYAFVLNSKNGLANQYRGKLQTAVNDERGSILTLSIGGYNPTKMATYLNKLMEVFIRSDLEEKNARAENTIDFINDQLTDLTRELNQSEMALQNFRLENQVIDLGDKGRMLFERLTELEKRLLAYELRDRYLGYLQAYIEQQDYEKPLVAPTTLEVEQPVLEGLVTQFNTKREALMRLKSVASLETREGKLLTAELNELIQAMDDQLVVSRQANQQQQRELEAQKAEVERAVQTLPVNERKLVNIEREFKINNELYTFLLEKRAEAGITRASNIADNKILDQARPENARQTGPNKKMNWMMALVIGLGLPGGVILLLDFLDDKVRDKGELERKTGLPVLATISHYEKKNSLAVYESPRSPLAESFRGLRTNLQYFATDKAHKVIMLTSTVSGEGKTFMGTNLATVLAMAGKRTVLLGFDLRKTSLHETFELTNNTGISSYLIGKDKLQNIVYKTTIPDLYVAPSGPLPPNPAELIETDRMDTLMAELKNDFDYVIIDTPPIAIVTDAMLLSRYADVNLLIVRQGFSRKGVYDFIHELKAGGKLKNPALVVNDARAKGYGKYYMQKYGYGYGYGYGYEG